MKTPCDFPDDEGNYRCPYSDDPTSEMCNRTCCGLAVDEDSYPYEDYEQYEEEELR